MIEIKKELNEILGSRPVTCQEFEKTQTNKILRLPGNWETMASVGSSLVTMIAYGLPEDYYQTYAQKIRGLTLAEVDHAAREVIHPDHLLWIVIGDRAKIEAPLRALGYGEVKVLDGDGRIVPGSAEVRPIAARPLTEADQAEVRALAPGDATALEEALAKAGANRGELLGALKRCTGEQREAMAFLIANMPDPDLGQIKADYLVQNVALAFKARAASAWGRALPQAIFLNDVLPYASINERRDDWRKDFYERFAPLVRDCKTPGEAAVKLNASIFKMVGVQYHATKRPKPDQSPYESIAAHYASCTGLSVLLVDACRAVGVPARIAGTPSWTTMHGNHTWVEIWNDGKWNFTGGRRARPAEPGLVQRPGRGRRYGEDSGPPSRDLRRVV